MKYVSVLCIDINKKKIAYITGLKLFCIRSSIDRILILLPSLGVLLYKQICYLPFVYKFPFPRDKHRGGKAAALFLTSYYSNNHLSFNIMFCLDAVLLLMVCVKISKLENSILNDLYLRNTASLQDLLMNERDRKLSYRKNTPPSPMVSIDLYFELLSLNEFDEARGRFECNGMLRLNWSDRRLSWDISEFNNTMAIPFMSSEVWKPQISLLNTFSKFIIINDRKEESVIWFTSDGIANLMIAGVYDVTCDPNVKNFPFDSHECVLLFIPFENLLFPDDASPFTIGIMKDSIIKDNFEDRDDDGKWIYKTTNPCIVKLPNRKLSVVAFPVIIHRRSTFALVNIILPVMMLGFLNLTVFFQPVQAGERISFSITVLLSFTVFMIYIGEIIPETSNPMPLLSYVLVFKLGCSTCIVIAITIVTRLFHREKRKVSPWVHRLLARFFNMGPCFSSRERDEGVSKTRDETNASRDSEQESYNEVTHSLDEPKDDWGRMCLALDKLFFLFFLSLLLMESVSYIIAYFIISASKGHNNAESQICTNGLE